MEYGRPKRMHNLQCSRLLALAIFACQWVGPACSFELGLPIDCDVGRTCFIQNYVDHDSSPAARDYTCGHETYDGHDGTDFRLPSMIEERAGVAVHAAADGQVLRTRDGMCLGAHDRIRSDQGPRVWECGDHLPRADD